MKRCSNKECCEQCRYDKMARTKTNTQNDTKARTTSWRIRHLEKKLYFCVFRI